MEKPLWEQQSFPEKLFRFSALLCLVGWGGSAIYIAGHVGSMEDAYFRARDMASYFFTAIWIFIFFYAQYRIAPRFIHRDLDRRIGLWHAVGSLALLIFGALQVMLAQTKSDLPSSLLFWITLLGEAALIGNVLWSYLSRERKVPILPVVPSAKSTPEHVPNASSKNMGWPKSPARLFGIGAAFFAGGGIVSIILNVPSFPIPFPISGQMHFLPYGLLWLVAAVPFGVFSLLYKYLMKSQKIAFEESLNRLHFIVTMIAVFDMVRVFMAWEQKLVSKMLELYFGPEFFWLAVFFVFSAAVFVINIVKSGSQSPSRT